MIDPPRLGSFEKVLVRGVNWIGDTILTLPSIEALRNLLPKAHITLLARDHLHPLFRNAPWVDEIISCSGAGGIRGLEEEARLARRIREAGYDLALMFPRSPRAALTPWLAGVRFRVGYAANGRGILLTHRLKESRQLLQSHQADYYYKLVQFLGARGARPLPRLYIGREEDDWAESFYDAAGISGTHAIIAINPGSTYGPAKCWPVARYIQLARRLLSSSRNRLLLVGGSDNADLINYMYVSLNRQVARAVGEDLMRLAALLKRCRLLITNDTGPMHMAAAVETPLLAIFGSTDPVTTSPLGPRSRLIRKHLDCSPCLKRRCPYDHRCMEALSVDEVEAAVCEHAALSGRHALRQFKQHHSSIGE
jgi:heptosyltransferase-2